MDLLGQLYIQRTSRFHCAVVPPHPAFYASDAYIHLDHNI